MPNNNRKKTSDKGKQSFSGKKGRASTKGNPRAQSPRGTKGNKGPTDVGEVLKAAQSMAEFNPFKHYLQSSVIPTSDRFTRSTMALDFETDIANIIALVKKSLYLLINASIISKWNATQQENYAYLTAYGAQLLYELATQIKIRSYIPTIAKDDTLAAGDVWSRQSLNGIIDSVEGVIKLPAMSFALHDFFKPVIQLHGAESMKGTPARYFAPFSTVTKTTTTIETLIDLIEGKFDAAVYAAQASVMLMPITRVYLEEIVEVSYNSHFTNMIAHLLPISDDADLTQFREVDETLNLRYDQNLGIPPGFSAATLLRCTECADTPQFYTFAAAGAGKLNLESAVIGDTIFTEVLDTVATWDWLENAAKVRGENSRGRWAYTEQNPYIAKIPTPVSSPEQWDRYLQVWLYTKARTGAVLQITDPVLFDYVTSGNRGRNGGGVGGGLTGLPSTVTPGPGGIPNIPSGGSANADLMSKLPSSLQNFIIRGGGGQISDYTGGIIRDKNSRDNTNMSALLSSVTKQQRPDNYDSLPDILKKYMGF